MVSIVQFKQGPSDSDFNRTAKTVWLIMSWDREGTFPDEGLESDLEGGTWRAF